MSQDSIPQSYLKYKICVSGSADTTSAAPGAYEKTVEVGREIVRQGGILVSGATTGAPYWAAIGAKQEGGISIGISPAATELAHVKSYRLPTDYFDMIIYTGFDYSGRNLILTRASDAVITVCGRIGTLNEFTIAFEDNKPQGILTGTGGMADMIKDIVERAHKGNGKVVYDSNPKRLVAKVIEMIKKEKVEIKDAQKYRRKNGSG
ncbi:LOG family protein [Candidatus Uhrbacteria bacterium]|nr:LOG family protein [Candidatus Uhrbacteria bacterium]